MATPIDPQQTDAPQESLFAMLKKEILDIQEKDKDEDLKTSPYYNLTVSTVIQECRLFNDASVVTQQPDKCIVLLAKLLYLMINDNKELSGNEISDVFFSATKLFQSQDLHLRRMTYLFFKNVAEKTSAEEVIIVVSTLLKDLNSDTDMLRSNAVRVLSRILDGNMLQQVERYIKQAIVHKNPAISSAAILSGLYLYGDAPDVIRRWINEINQQINNKDAFVQYHSILLLYLIKQNDKLVLNKFLSQLRSSDGFSPISICTIIKYTLRFILSNKDENINNLNSSNNVNLYKDIYSYFLRCLRHPSELVSLEAARAICMLPDASEEDIRPAVNVLQIGITSSKATTRFACLRTLNILSANHPGMLVSCNADLEYLINDPNRAISALAISTLLKTVSENKVDSLIKQITSTLSDIDDEFKQVLIKAVYILCTKFSNKHVVLLNFLASFIREEGSYEMKSSVVNTIIKIVTDIPVSLEIGLSILCEFIEDCEFTQLNVKIIDLIAKYGPSTTRPAKYIRFIYNRIILENNIIRAAAVNALTLYGLRVPSLAKSISLLLQRCLDDEDDEVRDRAIVAIQTLATPTDPLVSRSLLQPFPESFSMPQLKASIALYKTRPTNEELSWETLPQVSIQTPVAKSTASGSLEDYETSKTTVVPTTTIDESTALLYKIPEFASLGSLVHSSMVTPLTEEETEYVVYVVKHIFASAVVYEYQIKNTVEDQVMENVVVNMTLNEGTPEEWVSCGTVPCPLIRYNEIGRCYQAYQFAYDEEYSLPEASYDCVLKCITKECNEEGEPEEDDEGYEEDYPIESVTITLTDYIGKSMISDFRASWNEISEENEVENQFSLPFNTLPEAVQTIISTTGLYPLEGTGNVNQEAVKHNLILGGKLVGQLMILVHIQLAMTKDLGCLVRVKVRSGSEYVRESILALFD